MVIVVVLFLLSIRTCRYYMTINSKNPFAIIVDAVFALWRRIKTITGSPDLNEMEASQKQRLSSDGGNDIGRRFWKLFPIWVTCLMYVVCFAQTTTVLTKQGSTMERTIRKNPKVPAVTLRIFVSCTIIIVLPLYDRIFVPAA